MRFTRAAPARPTSSWTWPICRRSAPFMPARRRARHRTSVSSPSERRWPARAGRRRPLTLLLEVTDADDELAYRLVLLHGGVRLLDLRQLVDLMNRHRESSGGDRVEVALKLGLRKVTGVAAVAGETHAAGDVADGVEVRHDPLVRHHPGRADGAVDPGGL